MPLHQRLTQNNDTGFRFSPPPGLTAYPYLGSGGYSIVFRAHAEKDGVAHAVAVKLPLDLTKSQMGLEHAVLTDMAKLCVVDMGLMSFVALSAAMEANRVLAEEVDTSTSVDSAVLYLQHVPRMLALTARFCVLTPCGTPLIQHMQAGVAATERRAFARTVTLHVLHALVAAHSAGWAHCDVRPSNIIWHEGRAVLIDWGLASRLHVQQRGWSGVYEFVADALLQARGKTTRYTSNMDLWAAVYTYVTLAYGRAGRAPWAKDIEPFCTATDDFDMTKRRAQQLDGFAEGDVFLATLCAYLRGAA
ncbi:MAG: hypothetical protein EOO65_03465 [Methanosarcinales archaeon]|nr:MAG: hypothetical protein EOO65_03465 [Methanosarcinales archaeon]